MFVEKATSILPVHNIYTHDNFNGLIFCEWQLRKDFSDFIFIVHCIDYLCRMKTSWTAKSLQNPCNLLPLNITMCILYICIGMLQNYNR